MRHGRFTFLLGGLLALGNSAGATLNTLSRALERTTAQTNAAMIVTVRFTNTSPNAVRGFYYADQLPSALNVTTLSVRLNGVATTNYTEEIGLDGDVYSGCTPHRWLFERPEKPTVTNQIPAQATAEIVFALTATNSGTFALQPAAWVGFDRVLTNALFGFDTATAPPAVSFLTTLANAPLHIGLTNGRARLTFTTEANVAYQVQYTENLGTTTWTALTNFTGSGGLMLVEDPVPLRPARFYRTRIP
ncbi:MAG: hypothetical protein QM813_17800 [Verrucomicrobiota bacterium]